jgi:putative oxidoreductase
VEPIDVGLLVLRVVFGLFLAAHGYNKVFGGGGLEGTARWFDSLGMRWPQWQARIAASTEMGAGILFALGLLTPFAAAGMIGIMVVAGWSAHRHNGFFIFRKGEGWEYVASIGIVAWGVATIGPGELSIDHAIGLDWTAWDGWIGAVIAGVLGVGGAIAQLAICYRPTAPATQ